MKKIIHTLFLILLCQMVFGQEETFIKRDIRSFEYPDGRSNMILNFTDFINQTGFDGTPNLDYFRDVNTFKANGYVYVTINIGANHSGGKLFKALKFTRGTPGVPLNDSIFTRYEIIDIPIENFSVGYSYFGGDTIYAIQRYNPNGTTSLDSILKLDTNFQRLAPPIYFDANVYGTRYSTNKLHLDDSGYFYMAPYNNFTFAYETKILRSASLMNLDSFNVVDTITFDTLVRRPEEGVVFAGKNGALHCAVRSDYGGRVWIATSTNGGLNWGEPYEAGIGGNLPKFILTQDSVIVGLPSRLKAWANKDEELQFAPLDYNVENRLLKDGRNYTNFLISWDNAQSFSMGIVDLERTSRLTPNVKNLPDGADLVEIGQDTVRIYYTVGMNYDNTHSIGGLYYCDLVLKKEGYYSLLGGEPIVQPLYQSNINANKFTYLDTANDYTTVVQQDSNSLEFISPTNTLVSISNGNLIVRNGRLGIGTSTPSFNFDLNGTSIARFNNFANNSGITMQSAGNFLFHLKRADGFTGNSLHIGSFSGIAFDANNTTSSITNADMYLNTNGRLGIGTVSPAQTLDVQGTARLATTPESASESDSIAAYDATTKQFKAIAQSYFKAISKAYVDSATGGIGYADTGVNAISTRVIAANTETTLYLDSLKTIVNDTGKALGINRMFSFSDSVILLDTSIKWVNIFLEVEGETASPNQKILIVGRNNGDTVVSREQTFKNAGQHKLTAVFSPLIVGNMMHLNGLKFRLSSDDTFIINRKITYCITVGKRILASQP